MVAAGDHGVPSVSVLRPDGVCQDLVLATVRSRPDRDADFLEAHKVSPGGLQRFAYQRQRLLAAQRIETLMSVQGNQPQRGELEFVGFR